MLSFTKGAETLSIFLDGVFHSIDKSHINYGALDAELARPRDERRLDMIRSCISIKAMIEVLTFGNLTISETEVLFEGTKIGGLMAERLLSMLGKGLDIAPFASFMNNVFANPATYTRDELHQWMKKARLPITPDGCFLAFKKVRADYMDCHTGKCDNTPGNTLFMDRGVCDPNRHNHCSSGFHFASPGYFKAFSGERTLVVKVNPRDVTAIPSDYQYTKGRTCRYVVVAEIPESKSYDSLWQSAVVDLSGSSVPAWVLSSPSNGRVIGADGDPSDDVMEMEQAAAEVEAEQIDAVKGNVFVGPPVVATGTIVAAKMMPGRIHYESFAQLAQEPVTPGLPEIRREDDRLIVTPPADVDNLSTFEKADLANAAVAAVDAKTSDLPDVLEPTSVVFTTTDSREFTGAMLKQAMTDASIRGAARNLNIGESTLRGWLKRIDA